MLLRYLKKIFYNSVAELRLKRNFLLSSTQLRRLFEQGVISLLSGKEPQKYKVKDGDILLMDKEHLLVMMDFVDSFMVKTGID